MSLAAQGTFFVGGVPLQPDRRGTLKLGNCDEPKRSLGFTREMRLKSRLSGKVSATRRNSRAESPALRKNAHEWRH